MKTYKEKCPFHPGHPECDVYVLETLKDWDEYEEILKSKSPEFLKFNPNFYSFKEDFEKYIGKTWKPENNSDAKYKVIALEDNGAAMDWYWIVQNIDDPRDTKYLLANSYELTDGLID